MLYKIYWHVRNFKKLAVQNLITRQAIWQIQRGRICCLKSEIVQKVVASLITLHFAGNKNFIGLGDFYSK